MITISECVDCVCRETPRIRYASQIILPALTHIAISQTNNKDTTQHCTVASAPFTRRHHVRSYGRCLQRGASRKSRMEEKKRTETEAIQQQVAALLWFSHRVLSHTRDIDTVAEGILLPYDDLLICVSKMVCLQWHCLQSAQWIWLFIYLKMFINGVRVAACVGRAAMLVPPHFNAVDASHACI